jgi:hypothetical protein
VKDPNAGSTTNYPSPRHAGLLEWVKEQVNKLRGGGRGRSARGAYEETGSGGQGEGLYSGGSRRGRDVEDDAWDSRVGGRDEETYGGGGGGNAGFSGYEEQELGLAPTPGYAGGAGGAGAGGEYASYDDERSATAGKLGRENPFGDHHEAPSLRSVSPRPESSRAGGAQGHTKGQDSLGSAGSDGSQTRKSAFRENMS